MATIHISEAEAARDFAEVMARVRAGDDVVIDGATDQVTMTVCTLREGWSISEALEKAERHAAERGYDVVMGSDFAADLDEIVRNRKPRERSAWD